MPEPSRYTTNLSNLLCNTAVTIHFCQPSAKEKSPQSRRENRQLRSPLNQPDLPVPRCFTIGDVELRHAEPSDAMAVAQVHVRSWQVAYRKLMPDEYLDQLRPEDRAQEYNFGNLDPLQP